MKHYCPTGRRNHGRPLKRLLDTTCKENASKQITQGNETLLSDWQKESWQTFEDTCGYNM
jgi:hypothetical protein